MFKGRHFDQSVILLCVRWYLAYGLSLRDLKAMMAEGGISVDHSTIHRWVVHFSPLILERFNRKKRANTHRLIVLTGFATEPLKYTTIDGVNLQERDRPSMPALECAVQALRQRWRYRQRRAFER